MDLAKYRNLFLEEATEHLAEMSRALLTLEKAPDDGEAIDLVFRMAHSIKGMAGSLDYDSITELAHRLEDRMDAVRQAGRVQPGDEIALLFRGLEGLEAMVGHVRESGEAPSPDEALTAALGAGEADEASTGEPEPAPAPAPAPSEASEAAPPPDPTPEGLKKKA